MPFRVLVIIFFLSLSYTASADRHGSLLGSLKSQAKKSDRVILLGFFSKSCSPSNKMDSVLQDPELKAIVEKNLVFEKIDLDDEPNLGERYGFRSTPTFVFMTPDGTVLRRVVGHRDKETFQQICASIRNRPMTAAELLEDDWDLERASEAAQELRELGRNFEAFGVLFSAFEEGRAQEKPSQRDWNRVCFLLGDVSGTDPGLRKATERLADRWSEEFKDKGDATSQAMALAVMRSSLGGRESIPLDFSRLQSRSMKKAYVEVLQVEFLELGLGEEVREFGTIIQDYHAATARLAKQSEPSLGDRLGWSMGAARRYQLHLLLGELDEAYELESRILAIAPERGDWLRMVLASRACDCKRATDHHRVLLENARQIGRDDEPFWSLTRARVKGQLGQVAVARTELEKLLQETDVAWRRVEIQRALEELVHLNTVRDRREES